MIDKRVQGLTKLVEVWALSSSRTSVEDAAAIALHDEILSDNTIVGIEFFKNLIPGGINRRALLARLTTAISHSGVFVTRRTGAPLTITLADARKVSQHLSTKPYAPRSYEESKKTHTKE